MWLFPHLKKTQINVFNLCRAIYCFTICIGGTDRIKFIPLDNIFQNAELRPFSGLKTNSASCRSVYIFKEQNGNEWNDTDYNKTIEIWDSIVYSTGRSCFINFSFCVYQYV